MVWSAKKAEPCTQGVAHAWSGLGRGFYAHINNTTTSHYGVLVLPTSVHEMYAIIVMSIR